MPGRDDNMMTNNCALSWKEDHWFGETNQWKINHQVATKTLIRSGNLSSSAKYVQIILKG
jgi:hypothetical protein